MPNQYVNKVVTSNGTTLIDLTGDTVTDASHIMAGKIGHLADGMQVTGTGQSGDNNPTLDLEWQDVYSDWQAGYYYNPDDEWSIASVSCINIVKKDSCFIIKCTKKLDEIIDRPHKTYGICFSPAGNGKYSKNLNTGLTLQDDFVTCIYQPLLNKNKGVIQ